jgi:hypothetical protein
MRFSAAKFIGTAVIASTMLVAAAPAEARHRHHRDRVDAGDVIAGIFLIGAIAAIADGASKSKQRERRERDEDYRYEPQRSEQDYRAVPDDGNAPQWTPGSNGFEARAVDACSWAAEGEVGDQARVGQIDSVVREGDGWQVTGNVAAPETMPRDFTCTFSNGRVSAISLR